MAFTSKVSNIIKNNLSNYASGQVSGLVNTLANRSQSTKLAAKIASQSPLEIENSPVSHMQPKANPYNYGYVYYPESTNQLGEGHYIIFDIIMNRLSRFERQTFNNKGQLIQESGQRLGERADALDKRYANLKKQGFIKDNGEGVIRKQKSGQASMNETHSFISDSIILYTPPAVKFDYSVSYENADTGLAGMLAEFKGIKDVLEAGGDVFLNFIKRVGISALEIAFPGLGGLVGKREGRSFNPKTELAFKSVPFREFSFPFEFAPKNQKELDAVHKIIQLFKFHMHPEISLGDKGGYLIAPSEFQLTYMYRDIANMYIPKISRCALKDMSVDYAPEGVFTTFKADPRGAAPVLVKMNLTFSEMEIMTKDTIGDGH